MDNNQDKSISTNAYNDQVIWFNNFTNNIIGVLGFSLGITSLQFGSDAPSFATICLCFLFTYLWYVELKIFSVLVHHYKGMKFYKVLSNMFMNNLIYLLGVFFLLLIATGTITQETFVGFSLKHLKQWLGA